MFYENVSLGKDADGFIIELDGKAVKTPAGKQLLITYEPLANAVADEWRAQKEKIVLATMPLTTLCYAAIDQVAENRALIESEVAAFAGSDLICYRADVPTQLQEKECAAWDPIVAWLAVEHGVKLLTVNGIRPIKQHDETLSFMTAYLAKQNHFSLAAIQRLTGLLGSIFLAFAIDENKLSPDDAWLASRIDEMYQAELWGEDAEAKEEINAKYAQFCASAQLLQLSKV